jgi:hypothetical protein
LSIQALLQPHVRQWIKDHEKDEPAQLMLQAHRFPDIPVREAVEQVQARQKVRQKIPSWYFNEQIIYPSSLSVEQSSSEETALYKARLLQGRPGHAMADLTGGMGVDTFFLSRHFRKGFYIEQQPDLCRIAAHNFQILKADHIEVINSTAEEFIKRAGQPMDLLYLDPARRGRGNQKLYKLADCQPDVTALLPTLFAITQRVLLKAAPMLDIQQALSELEAVKKVHVVAVKNEVKELLFLMEKGFSGEAIIKAANLQAGQEQAFRFSLSEEQEAVPSFSDPKKFLYEPHAALLKAGAFKLLSQQWQLDKLHPNSHLYTSDEPPKPDFPGRTFQILYAGKADKKALRRYLPEGKALISTRNFPLSVQQLAKKYGLQEGGSRYLFATTFKDGKPQLILCEKVML